MKSILKSIIFLLFLIDSCTVSFAQIKFIDSKQSLGRDGYGCAIGDLNNDGYPDIYIANADEGPDQVWFNNGKGVFTNSGQNIGNAVKRDRSVALADLNGDGFLDVFIANDQIGNPTGCPNEVWLNDGTGKFTDSGQRLGNFGSSEVALGDINGDGYIDAVIANLHDLQGNNQPNEIWLNDGHGNFTNSGINLGERAYSVMLTDVNNDRKLDIIFDCTIWINNGDLNFIKSTQTFGNGRRLYFGDFNRDGYPDAFVLKGGPSGDTPNEIWFNDGTGNFTDSGQRLGNSCGYSAAIADFDGDGDLDIYVANGFANKIEPGILWINQSGKQEGTLGTFKESGIIFPPAHSWEVRTEDFDNNGNIDLLITNGWGKHENNKIYFNFRDTGSTGINNKGETLLNYFELNQNFPNPFNPTTVISYQLSDNNKVKLKIYNALGQKIKTLVDSFQNVGEHSIVWNGTDDSNKEVSSGIYIYKIQSNGMNLQKKMILIR